MRILGIADGEGVEVFFDRGDKRLERWSLYNHALCGHANLARVEESAKNDGSRCLFYVGIRKDLVRRTPKVNMAENQSLWWA